MTKIMTFATRASAEKAVAFLRRKISSYGFEAGVEPSGKFGVRVFDARGKFITWSAPVALA